VGKKKKGLFLKNFWGGPPGGGGGPFLGKKKKITVWLFQGLVVLSLGSRNDRCHRFFGPYSGHLFEILPRPGASSKPLLD